MIEATQEDVVSNVLLYLILITGALLCLLSESIKISKLRFVRYLTFFIAVFTVTSCFAFGTLSFLDQTLVGWVTGVVFTAAFLTAFVAVFLMPIVHFGFGYLIGLLITSVLLYQKGNDSVEAVTASVLGTLAGFIAFVLCRAKWEFASALIFSIIGVQFIFQFFACNFEDSDIPYLNPIEMIVSSQNTTFPTYICASTLNPDEGMRYLYYIGLPVFALACFFLQMILRSRTLQVELTINAKKLTEAGIITYPVATYQSSGVSNTSGQSSPDNEREDGSDDLSMHTEDNLEKENEGPFTMPTTDARNRGKMMSNINDGFSKRIAGLIGVTAVGILWLIVIIKEKNTTSPTEVASFVLLVTAEVVNFLYYIIYIWNSSTFFDRKWKSLKSLTPSFNNKISVSALIYRNGHSIKSTVTTLHALLNTDVKRINDVTVHVCDDQLISRRLTYDDLPIIGDPLHPHTFGDFMTSITKPLAVPVWTESAFDLFRSIAKAMVEEIKDVKEEDILVHINNVEMPARPEFASYAISIVMHHEALPVRISIVGRLPAVHRDQGRAAALNNCLYNFSYKHKPRIIAVFENGMLPSRSFLQRTIPFLFKKTKVEAENTSKTTTTTVTRDGNSFKHSVGYEVRKNVGFVQTPIRSSRIMTQRWNDRLSSFSGPRFDSQQRARDYHGCSFLLSTNCVINRRALDKIGGFPLSSSSEFILAGKMMHKAGMKSVFLNETLVDMGLCPNVAESSLERLRSWKGFTEMCLHRFILGDEIYLRANQRPRLAKEAKYEDISDNSEPDSAVPDDEMPKKKRWDRMDIENSPLIEEEEFGIPRRSLNTNLDLSIKLNINGEESAPIQEFDLDEDDVYDDHTTPRSTFSFFRRTTYWQIQFEPFAFLTSLIYAFLTLLALVSNAYPIDLFGPQAALIFIVLLGNQTIRTISVLMTYGISSEDHWIGQQHFFGFGQLSVLSIIDAVNHKISGKSFIEEPERGRTKSHWIEMLSVFVTIIVIFGIIFRTVLLFYPTDSCIQEVGSIFIGALLILQTWSISSASIAAWLSSSEDSVTSHKADNYSVPPLIIYTIAVIYSVLIVDVSLDFCKPI